VNKAITEGGKCLVLFFGGLVFGVLMGGVVGGGFGVWIFLGVVTLGKPSGPLRPATPSKSQGDTQVRRREARANSLRSPAMVSPIALGKATKYY